MGSQKSVSRPGVSTPRIEAPSQARGSAVMYVGCILAFIVVGE